MSPYESIPAPTPIEREIMELNLDLGYTMSPLSGYDATKNHYVFQPTIKSTTAYGTIERPLEIVEIEAYGALLQKALNQAGLEYEVITKDYPSVHVVVQMIDWLYTATTPTTRPTPLRWGKNHDVLSR